VIVPRTQFFDWQKLGSFKWTRKEREKWLESRKASRGVKVGLVHRLAKAEGPFYPARRKPRL